MFRLVGVLVALYTLYAVVKGEVYAKSGTSGHSVSKATSPRYFWAVIAIYAALGIALLTVF